MKSYTVTATDLESFKEQLNKSTYSKVNFAIIFAGVNHNFEELVTFMNTQKIEFAGCSSAGEIYNGAYLNNSIVAILMETEAGDYYQANTIIETGKEHAIACALSEKINSNINNADLMMFSSGIANDHNALIQGLRSIFGDSILLHGAIAGDSMTFQQTFVFDNEGVKNSGMILIGFDKQKIEIASHAVTGWKGIGKSCVITKSKGNIVYEIDNKPALDVFVNYFDIENFDKLKEEEIWSIPGQHPLEIVVDDETKYLRSIMIMNREDRSLVLAGTVEEGAQFRFCNTPSITEVDTTIEKYSDIANKHDDFDFSIMVSCAGRGAAFGPILEDEIEGIHKIWNKPMVGMLAYGEIGCVENQSYDFHNLTCSLITFKAIA